MSADGTLKFDTSLDSDGLQSGMGKLAGIAQTALGVFSGQMMTRAVDGLADLGKAALDSVGSLEQNVGGVETLFGNAADAVIAAADRAYQTAGLSANDYMSTVTSFSASLLQSLGGNTEEAAKVADMAIIDMADNANKMGTSMDAIQNAYQGFAKQNYTMLDNLKLGYGGTKTEMERLLADAQKLTGVEYDINNLNDVYQAIHVIQGELGITGTTAKEASTTLEGSMNAAKSAWDNFMNGSGDAGQLAAAFGTAAENIVNNLSQIIPRLAETLPQLAVTIVAQIPPLAQALIPAILSAVNGLLSQAAAAVTSFDFTAAAQSVVDMITSFIEGDGLRSFLATVGSILSGIVSGLSSMLPVLLPALVELVNYIVTTLLDELPMILDTALQLIQGLAEGIIAALPVLAEALPEIISTIITTLSNALPQIYETAITLLMELIRAIPEIVSSLSENLPQLITSIVDFFVGSIPDIFEAAKELLGQVIEAIPDIVVGLGKAVPDIIAGIVDGLLGGLKAVKDAALDLGGSILGGIKSFFGINSPSKVMTEQGDYLVQGLINGISEMPAELDQTLTMTLSKVTSWGKRMVSAMQSSINNVTSAAEKSFSQLPVKLQKVLTEAVNEVTEWKSKMTDAGNAAIVSMVDKIIEHLSQLPDKISSQLIRSSSGITSWGRALASEMGSVGYNIVAGLWNGISANWPWLERQVGGLAERLLMTTKKELGVNSPSTRFRDEVGKWILPGMQSGLAKTMPETLKDMRTKAGELVSAMQAEMTASTGRLSLGFSGAAALRTAGTGTTVYYDQHVEQENTYNVPTATPSEVAKAQREALRNMIGGVK